jgi:DNA-directed RNA polymerase specialized sigma24 family protein
MNNSVLTQEDFDCLLAWLDPDRETAGILYEQIRKGLINYYYFKGCSDGESLTDETINRVTQKIKTLDLTTENKPITLFYGFAANIFLEEIKKRKREFRLDEDFQADSKQTNHTKLDCLDKCLEHLSVEDRKLAVYYYAKNKSDKFEHRRILAEELGINLPSLHVKLYRIRQVLRKCIEECTAKKSL